MVLATAPIGAAAPGPEADDYALREAMSPGLEDFTGGHEVVVISGCACVVVLLLLILI